MTVVEGKRSDPASAPGAAAVLARSVAFEPEVGSNRRGAVAGAGWLYALPRLTFRRIACLGAPSGPTLVGLARATSDLAIVERSGRRRSRVTAAATRAGWAHVRVVASLEELPPGVAPDLLVVASGAGAANEDVRQAMARLAPDGLAWLSDGADETTRAGAAAGQAAGEAAGARTGLALDLRPGRGEARSVTRVDDVTMRASLRRLGLEGTWLPVDPRLERVVRRLPRPVRRRLAGPPGRRAMVSGGPELAQGPLPRYVREAAAGARDLDGWDWAVAARGDYDSQKVLVLLRPPDAPEPTGVVKVTRSDVHADRLDNEAAALARLAMLPVASGRAPAPWFHGHHAGRTLLGESLIEGRPFADAARWTPACPHLDDAATWLTDLGAATATPVPGRAVTAALLTFLERYERIYRPTPTERTALRDRFEGLARLPSPIPSVLQHGDPGTWNLLVDAAGRTVFLDWESAEPDGLPLWDLLYFLRSYAIGASRRDGVRDRLDAASRHLLDRSPLGDRIVELTLAYRERLGLPGEAVEALLLGCWLHRSLKEAGRLSADRLAEGQFVRLVRRMLARPDAPVLVAMTGVTR